MRREQKMEYAPKPVDDDEEIAALKEIIPIVSRLNAAQAENVLTFLLNKSQRELKARSIYGAQLLGLERK